MKLLPLIALGGIAFLALRTLRDRTAARRRTAAPTGDEAVARGVRERLAGIAGRDKVQVKVIEGTVSLSGRVSRAERDRLLRAALACPGVRAVTNQLEAQDAPPDVLQEDLGNLTGR